MCVFANPIFDHQPEQAIKTTICAIKSDPSVFNGKLVEVSGYATHGPDDSMFEDPTCFWGNAYPGTWMQYGGTPGAVGREAKPLVVQGVGVVLVHDSQFEQLDKLLHSSSKAVSVKATVRARFFVTPEMAEGKPTVGKGYGKRGCCMLFAIEQVTGVESRTPEPSIFDLAKGYGLRKP
jgi:hypothetical protein